MSFFPSALTKAGEKQEDKRFAGENRYCERVGKQIGEWIVEQHLANANQNKTIKVMQQRMNKIARQQSVKKRQRVMHKIIEVVQGVLRQQIDRENAAKAYADSVDATAICQEQ